MSWFPSYRNRLDVISGAAKALPAGAAKASPPPPPRQPTAPMAPAVGAGASAAAADQQGLVSKRNNPPPSAPTPVAVKAAPSVHFNETSNLPAALAWVRCTFEFNQPQAGEIGFRKGDIIKVIAYGVCGW